MKYHISVKFVAILLATVFLTLALGSAFGILVITETGLYKNSVDAL